MLNESNIIHFLQQQFPSHIGDDAAVIDYDNENAYVISKDLLIEDVHFRTSYYSPEDLAHKALHINLSDIAAMGAAPRFVLLGVGWPQNYSAHLTAFSKAFTTACQQANVLLIGGDTTSADKVTLSITLIGTQKKSAIKYRHTAKVGDKICVVGALGHANLGLNALEQKKTELASFKHASCHPIALIEEGQWLGEQSAVNAMMDISDGFALDMNKLCHSAQVAAHIHSEAFTEQPLFLHACQQLECDPLLTQLNGGEDYALLFTVDIDSHAQLITQFKNRFTTTIRTLGEITTGNGVCFLKNNQPISLTLHPYSHFGEL